MANPVLLNESFTLVPLSYEARSWIMQKAVQLHSNLDNWKALWTALGFSTYLQSNIKAMTDTRRGEKPNTNII